jgi:hypothetical protein
VNIILDRVNEQDRYGGATYLLNHGIDPLIDDRVTIAHNKIIVIDNRNVITGSFRGSIYDLSRVSQLSVPHHTRPPIAGRPGGRLLGAAEPFLDMRPSASSRAVVGHLR